MKYKQVKGTVHFLKSSTFDNNNASSMICGAVSMNYTWKPQKVTCPKCTRILTKKKVFE